MAFPLGYLLVPLLAVAGYFALEGSSAADAKAHPPTLPGGHPPPPGTPGAPMIIPSGQPAVDQELAAATADLLASYRASGGCAGVDVPRVQRFQRACNAYFGVVRGPQSPQLHSDGVYDQLTDAALAILSGGQGLAPCVHPASAGPTVPALPVGLTPQQQAEMVQQLFAAQSQADAAWNQQAAQQF